MRTLGCGFSVIVRESACQRKSAFWNILRSEKIIKNGKNMKNMKVAIVERLVKDIKSKNIFGNKKQQYLIAGFYFLSVIEFLGIFYLSWSNKICQNFKFQQT